MGIKVLIADRDVDFCQKIRDQLEDRFITIFAHSCDQAAFLARTKHIDLVLTSLDLPDAAPARIVEQFRDQAPETRVIVLSGSQEHNEEKGEEKPSKSSSFSDLMTRIASMGVDHIIPYPFASQDIRQAVDEELDLCISFV